MHQLILLGNMLLHQIAILSRVHLLLLHLQAKNPHNQNNTQQIPIKRQWISINSRFLSLLCKCFFRSLSEALLYSSVTPLIVSLFIVRVIRSSFSCLTVDYFDLFFFLCGIRFSFRFSACIFFSSEK